MVRKMSLKAKLTLSFAVVLSALVADTVIAGLSFAKLDADCTEARNGDETRAMVLLMQSGLDEQRAGVRAFLLGSTSTNEIDEGRRKFREAADQMPALLRTDEGKKRFAQVLPAAAGFFHLVDREVELRRSNNPKEAIAMALSPEAAEVRGKVESAIAEMVKFQDDIRHSSEEKQRSAQRAAQVLLAICSITGFSIGAVVAVLVPRSLARNLGSMTNVLRQIASNNLNLDDLEITSQDELGRAASALNTMKNNLRSLIQSIAGAAEHVASASEEISSSATQQAQSVETQKGQATQVSVAMQEMSTTVHEVSDNSSRAAEASRQAADTAREGGAIVEDSLAKMQGIAQSVGATAEKVKELGKSTDQIGRIISVIDDIADQTNLLALNAAIEAARAGEQGRGFAVVADEVRKLAERTTSATKEVAQMVESIQKETHSAVAAMQQGTEQVRHGVETTAKAGHSLEQIIKMSEQVGEMVSHIATASTEQASATEQVNQSIEQINRLVKESAIGAQQSSKACQDLSSLALDLQKMVSSFDLGAGLRRAPKTSSGDAATEATSSSGVGRAFSAYAG